MEKLLNLTRSRVIIRSLIFVSEKIKLNVKWQKIIINVFPKKKKDKFTKCCYMTQILISILVNTWSAYLCFYY